MDYIYNKKIIIIHIRHLHPTLPRLKLDYYYVNLVG